VKTALIGGIGNVLLGDDAVGPHLVHLIEARYSFGENIEIADLGTPALDLTHRIVGRDLVILIDAVACSEYPAGSLLLYRKEQILSIAPTQRLDPHSPAVSECLLAAEMLGSMPENVLLVGIVGESYEPGRSLSNAVQASMEKAIAAILDELNNLGFNYEERHHALSANIWWNEQPTHSFS
jgi:hydrogenase maturation protease